MKTNPLCRLLLSLPVLCGLVIVASLDAQADQIEVSNPAGQKMTVEVLKYTASSGNVRVERDDGQILNTKLSVFDKESQAKIINNAPAAVADLELDLSIGRKRERQSGSFYMKNLTITASAKVANQSRDIDLPETKFTVLLMGRNSRRYANREEDWLKVLSKQTFSTKLPAGKASEHELKSVKTEYDSDKDSSNVGGWEFEGYLMVGQDADGKIVSVKTTLGEAKTTTIKSNKLLLAALALAEGTQTAHDLSPLTAR